MTITSTTTENWQEREHPVFGNHGTEPAIQSEAVIGRSGMFPKKQWIKDDWSIIEPCGITFGQYELYKKDGSLDVQRFKTLEEAQSFADSYSEVNKEETV